MILSFRECLHYLDMELIAGYSYFCDMETRPDLKIYFAPLQESTDFIYRNAYAKIFGSVDKYFAPYISRQNDGTVKKSHLRDINRELNSGYNIVPQILAGNSADLVFLARILEDQGYDEINLNLGCPYPMVTNKGLGAGLLPYPNKIGTILEEALPKIRARISVKLRSGLLQHDEIYNFIDVLNRFPLSEIILHPRIAKDLYRGTPNEAVFASVKLMTKHPLIYNGDLNSVEDFNRLNDIFDGTARWMIGRGILKNPFLPLQIKAGNKPDQLNKVASFKRFHHEILTNYASILNGNSHLLMKMVKFWSYFCVAFPDPHKSFKRVKKAANIQKYEVAINENFQSLRYHEEN